jgi:selT/selW/selH-like putative selenoprotein
LQAAVEQQFPKIEVIGNPKTPRRASFEVTYGDVLLYSKLKTGNFPAADRIVRAIKHYNETGQVLDEPEPEGGCVIC